MWAGSVGQMVMKLLAEGPHTQGAGPEVKVSFPTGEGWTDPQWRCRQDSKQRLRFLSQEDLHVLSDCQAHILLSHDWPNPFQSGCV